MHYNRSMEALTSFTMSEIESQIQIIRATRDHDSLKAISAEITRNTMRYERWALARLSYALTDARN